MAGMDQLRAEVIALSDVQILDVLSSIEEQDQRSNHERLLYAVAGAVLCRRLSLDAEAVSGSALGVSEHLRLVLDLRAA